MHHSPGILEKSCCPSSTSPVTWMINDDCWRNDKFVRIFFVLLIRLYMSCIYIYIIYIGRDALSWGFSSIHFSTSFLRDSASRGYF